MGVCQCSQRTFSVYYVPNTSNVGWHDKRVGHVMYFEAQLYLENRVHREFTLSSKDGREDKWGDRNGPTIGALKKWFKDTVMRTRLFEAPYQYEREIPLYRLSLMYNGRTLEDHEEWFDGNDKILEEFKKPGGHEECTFDLLDLGEDVPACVAWESLDEETRSKYQKAFQKMDQSGTGILDWQALKAGVTECLKREVWAFTPEQRKYIHKKITYAKRSDGVDLYDPSTYNFLEFMEMIVGSDESTLDSTLEDWWQMSPDHAFECLQSAQNQPTMAEEGCGRSNMSHEKILEQAYSRIARKTQSCKGGITEDALPLSVRFPEDGEEVSSGGEVAVFEWQP